MSEPPVKELPKIVEEKPQKPKKERKSTAKVPSEPTKEKVPVSSEKKPRGRPKKTSLLEDMPDSF